MAKAVLCELSSLSAKFLTVQFQFLSFSISSIKHTDYPNRYTANGADMTNDSGIIPVRTKTNDQPTKYPLTVYLFKFS